MMIALQNLALALAIGVTVAFSSGMSATPSVNRIFRPTQFKCQVLTVIESGKGMHHELIVDSESTGSHGGKEHIFQDEKDEVVVIANGKWMGLAWWREGKKLAEVVNAITDPNVQHRVLIALNPFNNEERVSLDCLKL